MAQDLLERGDKARTAERKQGKDASSQETGEPKEQADEDLDLGLKEDEYEKEIIAPFNKVQGVINRQRSQIGELTETVAKMQQHFVRQENVAFTNRFDDWASKQPAEIKAIIGDKPAMQTDQNSAEYKLRVKICNRLNDLRAGAESRGEPVTEEQLLDQARDSVLGNKSKEIATAKIGKDLVKRKNLATARPTTATGKKLTGKQKADEATAKMRREAGLTVDESEDEDPFE